MTPPLSFRVPAETKGCGGTDGATSVVEALPWVLPHPSRAHSLGCPFHASVFPFVSSSRGAAPVPVASLHPSLVRGFVGRFVHLDPAEPTATSSRRVHGPRYCPPDSTYRSYCSCDTHQQPKSFNILSTTGSSGSTAHAPGHEIRETDASDG